MEKQGGAGGHVVGSTAQRGAISLGLSCPRRSSCASTPPHSATSARAHAFVFCLLQQTSSRNQSSFFTILLSDFARN